MLFRFESGGFCFPLSRCWPPWFCNTANIGDPKRRNSMTKLRREADKLDTSEHGREVKRMRTYSTDEPDAVGLDSNNDDSEKAKKRRTRSDLTVQEWRQQHQITVSDDAAPDPFREFAQTPFGNIIQTALTRAGFAKPTAIQAQAWSIGIAGKDMISIAKTGSGTCHGDCLLLLLFLL
jgi:hypothetical protein